MKDVAKIASIFLFENGTATLKIHGNSMYPSFCDGQTVEIQPLSAGSLHLGKCYVYISNGKLILHRLLWICQTFAYIAGDANSFIEKINISKIIGAPFFNDYGLKKAIIISINCFFFLFHMFPFIFKYRSTILKHIIKVL